MRHSGQRCCKQGFTTMLTGDCRGGRGRMLDTAPPDPLLLYIYNPKRGGCPHASICHIWDARGSKRDCPRMPTCQYTQYLGCPRLHVMMPAAQGQRARIPINAILGMPAAPQEDARSSRPACLRAKKTQHLGCPRLHERMPAAQGQHARVPLYTIRWMPAAPREDAGS